MVSREQLFGRSHARVSLKKREEGLGGGRNRKKQGWVVVVLVCKRVARMGENLAGTFRRTETH